jgi:hypothetical protein
MAKTIKKMAKTSIKMAKVHQKMAKPRNHYKNFKKIIPFLQEFHLIKGKIVLKFIKRGDFLCG